MKSQVEWQLFNILLSLKNLLSLHCNRDIINHATLIINKYMYTF